jgi:2-dehydropantoate 2-reductase
VNIIVYGAGVIGTIYAAKLREGGHRVTLLARGQRLTDIRERGLLLENIADGPRSTTQVDVVDRLAPDDKYDVALIAVRRDQLADVMAELASNRNVRSFLFMLNNPTGTARLANTLGRDRILLGFPGVGGARDGHVVKYVMIAQQPTTLGDLDHLQHKDLHATVQALRASGFRTRVSRDMDTWLKCHAFFVTAVCAAIYLVGGDCKKLSRDIDVLELMTNGVREGFDAVRALGRIVTPLSLRALFTWMPNSFAIRYWSKFFGSEMAEYVFGRHARAAASEMHVIANDCRDMLAESRVGGNSLLQLYDAIDAYSK